MTSTRKKIEIYKDILKELENNLSIIKADPYEKEEKTIDLEHDGLCEMISYRTDAAFVFDVNFNEDFMLNQHMPPQDEWEDSYYWFPFDEEGYEKRIEIIKKMIKEEKEILRRSKASTP